MDEKAYQSHLNGKRHQKQMQKKSEKGWRAEIQNKKTPHKCFECRRGGRGRSFGVKNLLTPSRDKHRRPSWSSPESKLNGPRSPSLLTIMMQESQRRALLLRMTMPKEQQNEKRTKEKRMVGSR